VESGRFSGHKIFVTPSEYSAAQAWTKLGRQLLRWSLTFSALLSTFAAVAVSFLADGEETNVVGGLLLMFAGAALAVGIGFRRVAQPNWRHWVTAIALAIPGAIYILIQLTSAFYR